MDTIFVKQLNVMAIIGCQQFERHIKQRLRLSFEIATDAKKISETDNIDLGYDYAMISERLKVFVEASEFQLIETLAEAVSDVLFKEFHVKWLKLTVEKPGAVPDADTVGITIERGHR